MTSEQQVKKKYPKAVVQPWPSSYGLHRQTFKIYPDEQIFHGISDECDTESAAWDNALTRIKNGGKS